LKQLVRSCDQRVEALCFTHQPFLQENLHYIMPRSKSPLKAVRQDRWPAQNVLTIKANHFGQELRITVKPIRGAPQQRRGDFHRLGYLSIRALEHLTHELELGCHGVSAHACHRGNRFLNICEVRGTPISSARTRMALTRSVLLVSSLGQFTHTISSSLRPLSRSCWMLTLTTLSRSEVTRKKLCLMKRRNTSGDPRNDNKKSSFLSTFPRLKM
jgi:hypothetical protein